MKPDTKLEKKFLFAGEIELVSGLLIGGTDTGLTIGGIDKVVIRHPLTNEPYIPGSSLKGKMRSLYELSTGNFHYDERAPIKNGPARDGLPAWLYGNATSNDEQRPSRLIVRDAFLSNANNLLEKTEIPYVEVKTEVVIDRITSKALPRTFERVPAGARFGLQMILNIFENDKAPVDALLQALASSLRLLQDDYLGGSGSRGYGQVKIKLNTITVRSSQGYYLAGSEATESLADEGVWKYFDEFRSRN